MNKRLKEVIRKSIHIGSLIIPISYRYIFNYNKLVMFLILLAALFFSLTVELYRINIPTIRALFHKLFGIILRKHERSNFTGATFLFFSSLISVVFFSPEIAFFAISFLSVGDTFAAITGLTFGRRRFINVKKSLEGSLGCFVSIMLFSILFASKDFNPVIYTIGAIGATLAEIWTIPLDDNVKIPVISGIIMTIASVVV
ncbi:MAG: phosphatidate cytidylyltransferase [Candidatus Cloacimonetes bacterium]|nr:phosphatidate cytidylyltransferase [Candidatus Cloacimonadota bacterium]